MDLEWLCADLLVCNSPSHRLPWQHFRYQSHPLWSHLASNWNRSIDQFSIYIYIHIQYTWTNHKEKTNSIFCSCFINDCKFHLNSLTSLMCCSSASVSVSSIDSFTPSMCNAGGACSTCDVWCTVDKFTTADGVLCTAVFRPCFDDFLTFECNSGDKFSASLSSSASPPCKFAAFFSFTMCILSRFCCFDEPFCRGLRSRVVDFVALTSSFGRSTDILICTHRKNVLKRFLSMSVEWNLPLAD